MSEVYTSLSELDDFQLNKLWWEERTKLWEIDKILKDRVDERNKNMNELEEEYERREGKKRSSQQSRGRSYKAGCWVRKAYKKLHACYTGGKGWCD